MGKDRCRRLKKIINDLLVADKERTVWPENTEPKFTGKKGTKLTKVAVDRKIKRYMHEGKEIPVEEPIRLDIPDSYIYFSFHPTKNEYVMIDTAKFIITAPFCHWIQERNITVIALLSYATRTTHIARGNVQKAIKDAPSEGILRQRIAKQECYTELVEIILAAITDLSDACDLSKEHGMHVEKINRMIEFICDKGMKPGCKTLTKETVFSDFLTAGNDTETMNSARDIMNTKMPGGKFIK